LTSREARARTRPSKSSTTSVMWSRSTLSPSEKQLSGLMTSLVAGWPRPPRRRPASWMRLSTSSRLVMLAMAGAVSPVITASSARVIGPLTRMACKVTR
jgi:hypothetical protein